MTEVIGILGVFLSIVVIMYLTRKQIPMGISMVIASLMVGISTGMSFGKIAGVTFQSLTSFETINLVLVVFFIGILGELLKWTGSLDQMLSSLNILIKDNRLLASLLPSLIGMLPVPGGAILSAPMVEEVGNKLQLSPSRMCGVNMFFRHIWYLIFPLFPAVILALEMSGVPLGTFLLLNLPATIITLGISFFWLFRGVSVYKDESDVVNKNSAKNKNSESIDFKNAVSFVQSIFPLLAAVFLAIVLDVYIPAAIFVGVVIAFLNYITISSQALSEEIKTRFSYLKYSVKWNMMFAVVGIMLYQGFIESSGMVDVMSTYLIEMGIPLGVLIFIVPFLAGFFTGHNLAAFGISYPIFGSMLPDGGAFYGLFGMLYVTSLAGYLISPIHLCLVLTREHFEANFKKIIYELSVPIVIMLVVTVINTIIWSLN